MDTKTEINVSPEPSFHEYLMETLKDMRWFPPLPKRFSVKEVINNINSQPLPFLLSSALKLPFRMLRYPGIALAFTAYSLTNPLGVDYNNYQLTFWITQQDLSTRQAEYQPSGLPADLKYRELLQISPEIVAAPKKEISGIENKLFGNFSTEEKALVEREIAEQIKIYKSQTGYQLKADRVLDWERTTIQPILDLDVVPKDQEFWSELLSAIVYVESEGKPLTKSEAGIVGLAQISQATASATARKHGLLQFDLRKGWDSLRLGRFHLQDLMERFGPDITLLGYYAGGPFTDQKVLAALVKKGVPKDDPIMKKGFTQNQQLHTYIDYYELNLANLGSADGEEYFIKTVAAHRILNEAKKINFNNR